MKCCLDCDNGMFLMFESADLGDKEYPICRPHILEFTESREGMLQLKSLLRGLPMESSVVPKAQPEPEPEDEDEDDWTPEL